MPAYHTFPEEAVTNAINAARAPHAALDHQAMVAAGPTTRPLNIHVVCISIVVENNQVCLELPLGLGRICLPIPFHIPNGTVVQACLDLCTWFGIPTGVCVTITFDGQQLVSQCFGFGC